MTLQARSLEASIGAFTLGPIDLAVGRGRVCALVGPNGWGKTTLLRCVAGVQSLAAGAVELAGRRVHGMRSDERARSVAFVPQLPRLPPALSVREVVELGRLRIGQSPAAVDRALDRVGLLASRHARADELSAGQSHRVAVARMLAQVHEGTKLVALDEPTSSLDPSWSAQVGVIVRELAEEGRAVLVATHDFGFLGTCCDEVALLREGRLCGAGAVAEVASPAALGVLFGTEFVAVTGLSARAVSLPRWNGVS